MSAQPSIKNSEQYSDSELELIAWSHVWSPIVPQDLALQAWQALELPKHLNPNHPIFIGFFLTGNPTPAVSTLLHVAQGQDGGVTREAMVRVMDHLNLDWKNLPMQPDHLAVACEIMALAIREQDPVLIHGLLDQYLFPWCTFALEKTRENDDVHSIIIQFKGTLRDISIHFN